MSVELPAGMQPVLISDSALHRLGMKTAGEASGIADNVDVVALQKQAVLAEPDFFELNDAIEVSEPNTHTHTHIYDLACRFSGVFKMQHHTHAQNTHTHTHTHTCPLLFAKTIIIICGIFSCCLLCLQHNTLHLRANGEKKTKPHNNQTHNQTTM
jgi:hypothetical protein